jgi:phenylacetate-coenzyme A ligase PaaK-like adenylate-forming protein
MPEMIVVCELADTGSTGDAADLAHELSARLSERLGVSGRVVIGPPGALPRSEVGKAVRLVRRTPDADGRPAELARLMDSPA